MLIFYSQKRNKEKLVKIYQFENNFNVEDHFGLPLTAAYPFELRAASRDGGQNGETASMRVLAIDLLLFYISRSYEIVTQVNNFRYKFGVIDTVKQYLKEALDLFDSSPSKKTNFRELCAYQILETLDELIFSAEETLTGKSLALLDGYKFQSPQAAGVECFESFVDFYKFFVKAFNEYTRRKLFKCLSEIVRKRLKSLKVDSYSTTWLPTYSRALSYLEITWIAKKELSVLSGHFEERLIEATKELAQENRFEVLLTGKTAGNLGKMQLRSYILGHIPMSFTGYPGSLDEDHANFNRIRPLVDVKSLIQLFSVPAEGEKKTLQSVLFFTLLTSYLSLESFKIDTPSEEECNTLIGLISEYHNPLAPEFKFLKELNKFFNDSESNILRNCLLKNSFVKNTLRVKLWFNDEILRCDTVAEYSGERVSYCYQALTETLEEMEQFSEDSMAEEEAEKVTKAQNQKAKEAIKLVVQDVKTLIARTNDEIIEGVLQGEMDLLIFVFRQRFILSHMDPLRDYLESVGKYLKSEDYTEILPELEEIFRIGYGFLPERAIEDLLSQDAYVSVNNQTETLKDAQVINSYLSIMEILGQFGPAAFDLFGSSESARQLSRSEIGLFQRIHYLYKNWQRLKVLDKPDREDLKGREQKLSSSAIQIIYRIFLAFVSKDDSLDDETEVPTMNLFGTRRMMDISDSLMNFILGGVFYASKYLESNSIDVLMDSLAKLLETETQVLKALKEDQLESKPPREIYDQIYATLRVVSLVATNLDDLYATINQISIKEGYIKIAFHKELLERFLDCVEAAEEYDSLLASKLEPTLIEKFAKQRSRIKFTLIKFVTRMSNRLLGESSQLLFTEYEARGFSQEEQLRMVDRISQLNYRVFTLINVSHFTCFAQEGQLIENSYKNQEIFSLVDNQPIQELPNNEEKDLTIFELKRKEAIQNTVVKNYTKIFQQFILLQGLPGNDNLHNSIKDLFEQLASNEEFQKFIHNLIQETQLIFHWFASEPVDKLADLAVKHLPLIQTQANSAVKAFFSAFLFKKLYEALLRDLPSEKRAFLEEQKFDFGASREDIYDKLIQLDQEFIRKLLAPNLFPKFTTEFQYSTSSESRAREHCKLYEIPFSEFTEHEKAVLESIFKGALTTLRNWQFYDKRDVSQDCVNLLLLTVWDSTYVERIQKDNIVDLLLKLEGEAKTNVIPFILDRLVGDVIPLQHRIEIALKAAFLKPIKSAVLKEERSLYYLQVFNQADPKTFIQLVEELLTAIEFNPKESNVIGKKNKGKKKGELWRHSFRLKDGVGSYHH